MLIEVCRVYGLAISFDAQLIAVRFLVHFCNPEPVQIPTTVIGFDAKIMAASSEADRVANGGPILPSSGRWNVDRAI